jgi:hypothetical protein
MDHHGMSWRINFKPQEWRGPKFADAYKHADPKSSYAQKSLIHGIDLADKHSASTAGVTSGYAPETGWYRNASGTLGYVKPDINESFDYFEGPEELRQAQKEFSLPHREVLFHDMAKNFFGIGEHVPTTAMFRHPDTNIPVSVQERVIGGFHFEHDDDDSELALDTAHRSGQLDKLALTDMFMGNSDRHPGNYMLTKKAPNVHLIDNGLSLAYGHPASLGYLWDHQHASSPDATSKNPHDTQIHPEAVKWMMSHDPDQFAKQLLANGVPPPLAKAAHARMRTLQLEAMRAKAEGTPLTREDLWHAISESQENL